VRQQLHEDVLQPKLQQAAHLLGQLARCGYRELLVSRVSKLSCHMRPDHPPCLGQHSVSQRELGSTESTESDHLQHVLAAGSWCVLTWPSCLTSEVGHSHKVKCLGVCLLC
jgi:hypothetical protein